MEKDNLPEALSLAKKETGGLGHLHMALPCGVVQGSLGKLGCTIQSRSIKSTMFIWGMRIQTTGAKVWISFGCIAQEWTRYVDYIIIRYVYIYINIYIYIIGVNNLGLWLWPSSPAAVNLTWGLCRTIARGVSNLDAAQGSTVIPSGKGVAPKAWYGLIWIWYGGFHKWGYPQMDGL